MRGWGPVLQHPGAVTRDRSGIRHNEMASDEEPCACAGSHGRLVTLRRTLKQTNPSALQHAHVGDGIFLPRSIDPDAVARIPSGGPPKELLVKMQDVQDEYEALGGRFTVHDEPLVPATVPETPRTAWLCCH